MNDSKKTKTELVSELESLRARLDNPRNPESGDTAAGTPLSFADSDYRTIFNAANDAIFVHDPETGEILDANDEMCRMFGYTVEEVRQLNVGALSSGEPPYAQEDALRLIRKAAGGKPQIFEWFSKTKDGRLFWVEVSLKSVVISGEKRLLAIVRDIGERKRVELKLRQSEKRYRELCEGSRDGFGMVDLEGTIVQTNSAFRKMIGYTEEELRTKTFMELTPEKWHSMEAEILQQQVHNRGFSSLYEKELIRKDGEIFPVEIRSYLLEDENGNPAGYWAFGRDITERKQAEQALKNAKDQLEIRVEKRTKELQKKTEEIENFTYSISHDLQAPLRAIQGFSEALLEDLGGRLADDNLENLLAVNRAAKNMGRLLRDMLDYARLGMHGFAINDIPLKMILVDAQFELIEDIKERDAEIKIPESLPNIKGHDRTLVRLVSNLISNAIKFVPPDYKPIVDIGVAHTDKGVRVSVRDNGIGIDPKYHKKIFVMFERLHSRDEYTGTGVGLAIAKKAAELHGGTIGVESELGQGSVFWFEIPD